MLHLICKRLGQLLLLLVLVTAATALLSSLIPGDFFAAHELDPTIAADTIRLLRQRYGLDQPLSVQYGRWLVNLASLDFGYSLSYQAPVSAILLSALGKTLWLALPALVIGVLCGVALGTLHATWRGHGLGLFLDFLSTVMLSLPSLVLGIAALYFASRTSWFPLGGMSAVNVVDAGAWNRLADRIHHLVLPVACLSIPIMATVERIQHTATRQTLDETFLRAARARGLGRIRIFVQHLLRPSLNTLVSTSGPLLGGVLSGSLILEVIFSWPGLGRITYDALFNRDVFLLLGSVVASTVLLVAGNLAADVMLLRLDPRTRSAWTGGSS